MRNIRVILLTFVLSTMIGCPLLDTQGSTIGWAYSFGHQFTSAHDVAQLSDGSYIVSGRMQKAVGDSARTFGVVIGPDGIVVRSFDDDMPKQFESIERNRLFRSSTNGFYVSGSTEDTESFAPGQLRMISLAISGEEVFDLAYIGQKYVPLAMLPSLNDGLWVTSFSTDGFISDSAVVLFIDSLGEIKESFELVHRPLVLKSIVAIGDGQVAVSGRGNLSTGDTLDFILWIPEEGDEQTQAYEYDFGGTEEGTALVVAPNGDFLLAGLISGRGALLRVAPDGELRWARTDFLETNDDDDADEVWDVEVTPDGNIAMVGQERRVTNIGGFFPSIAREGFIVLLDANGNLIWRTNLGSGNTYGLTYTQQNTFMTCGDKSDELTLIEVDINGNIIN